MENVEIIVLHGKWVCTIFIYELRNMRKQTSEHGKQARFLIGINWWIKIVSSIFNFHSRFSDFLFPMVFGAKKFKLKTV